jgi:hypothetical protein
VQYEPSSIDSVLDAVAAWQESGATHVSVSTMRRDFATVDEHITALDEVARALGLSS